MNASWNIWTVMRAGWCVENTLNYYQSEESRSWPIYTRLSYPLLHYSIWVLTNSPKTLWMSVTPGNPAWLIHDLRTINHPLNDELLSGNQTKLALTLSWFSFVLWPHCPRTSIKDNYGSMIWQLQCQEALKCDEYWMWISLASIHCRSSLMWWICIYVMYISH